ncbi:MAG: alpha/beta hydrolase domain-containing protein [Thalassobaculum sp.]|uniref:alpha/beta hydrolase domain-containing protein n=1 Tax=Thalassobaculum sp. TaxID=2022740 RepID=UPI0032EF4553
MSVPPTLSIDERVPFAAGHDFGDAGAYERLTGRVRLRADPNGGQPRIVDLDKAPRDGDGLVEYSADFCLLKPVEAARGNGRVFFDYGNRGNKRALQFFNDAVGSNSPSAIEHAGNGFLMRRGYTVAWLAWQGDLLPGDGRMLLDVPVATDAGRPITGTVRVEYIVNAPGTHVLPLSGLAPSRSYPAATLDTAGAALTRRRYAASRRESIPADAWSFSRIEESPAVDGLGRDRAVIPSDSHLHLHAGFETGWIYELIYEARDPRVLGLGHLAVRDFVSFLKHAEADAAGTPNPLREGGGRIEKAYAWGRSQTGRCIRDFVYLGFNADAEGRRVFDGVLPHVAGGGKMWMNHRFAQLTVLPGQEHENHYTLVDRFPFSYARSTDHLTGREDAILKRPDTDPLVIHTDSASEYWHRRASLVVTDSRGRDLPQPDGVRVQLWSSSQHYASPLVAKPERGIAAQFHNTVATSAFFRANLDALDRWATDGTPPPPSTAPSVADGTLVTADAWRAGFPAIPGIALPRGPSRLEQLDFGADVDATGVIEHEPPRVIEGEEYPVLVPATDADGLDRAGQRAPMVQAPLGTYAGWSLRRPELGEGAMVGITGCYLPFPDTAEERAQTGDPRPAILERYADAAAYQAAIRKAAEALVAEGRMLAEDAERAVAAAAGWNRARHVTRLPETPS